MDANIFTSDQVKQFISDHRDDDIQKLLLSPPAEFKEHITFIVDQILSRRKAKTKLPEWYANSGLILPPPLSLEQSSSPATSAYKSKLIKGEVLVDLTGGMGVDTIAFSSHFKNVHYVEMNESIYTVFEHNRDVLGKRTIKTHHQTAEDFLTSFPGKACFFIDPARRDQNKSRVFRFEDCSPNVVELIPEFKAKAKRVLVKAAPMIDLSLGIEELQYVSEVHVVSVKNEVKEVLFLLDLENALNAEPLIRCVNLETFHSPFEFRPSQERTTENTLRELGQYLYDPNSSILKAGAFKLVGEKFGLKKLATNTHLYTSDELINEFPGRVWKVIETVINKKNIAQLLPGGKANVITKNYPQKPDELKKKLKIKDGGVQFLIGFRNGNNKPLLILANQAK